MRARKTALFAAIDCCTKRSIVERSTYWNAMAWTCAHYRCRSAAPRSLRCSPNMRTRD